MKKALLYGYIGILFTLYVSVAFSPPPPTPKPDNLQQVQQAFLEAITGSQDDVLAYLLYRTRLENLRLSADRLWAIAFLVPFSTQTDYTVPTEPGLALAHWDGSQWQVYLPHQPQWATLLQSIPPDLLSAQDKIAWLKMYETQRDSVTLGPFVGYKLPWQANTSLVLTRSITHHSPPDPNGSMHYAFDFAAWHDSSGQSPMFPVLAARSGKVKHVRWQQENGSEASPGNYLVLEDTTTSPTTYQLYLHLAKDSIPEPLRIIGTPVIQGQFIGMADDTGYSTGNHLHFQVHTNPNSYWGSSVDIIFDEVAINGGRPRTPPEAQNYPQYGNQGQWEYTSANLPLEDVSVPSGTLTAPENGLELTSSLLPIAGYAHDDVGIASIRLKANYSDTWQYIGPIFNSSPISYTWDLCQAQVPDGPLSLAMEIQDVSGQYAPGLPGLRHLVKNYTCPTSPPPCNPDLNQVALFAEPDFKGACVVLDISDSGYPSSALGAVGDNNAASIKVGSQAQATLFINNNFLGRGETFVADDSNLSDNLVGIDHLSSLFVQSRNTLPSAPLPLYPPDTASFPSQASISLSWENRGGATEYRLRINGVDQNWQAQPFLHLTSLNPGTYTWQVQSRNQHGVSPWSPQWSFSIRAPSESTPLSPLATAPFTDTMETGYNGWISSTWDQNDAENHTREGRISWRYEVTPGGANYDTGVPNSGYLTSPPIAIPSSGYALRFWYLYETESPGQYWDQRWIQISDNGGPFANIFQLYDDPPNVWLPSPPINLSAYAGHTIQVRFYFATLDKNNNTYKGWYIDDFTINTYTPPTCTGTNEPDESPNLSRLLDYNQSLSGQICPPGDVDYFRFTGKAGDQIGIATKSQDIGSLFDPFIFLLDGDFTSPLAQNDDRYPGVQADSFLSYRLTRDGIYYIKLRAWNHPAAGGSAYNYQITLYGNDIHSPVASFPSLTNEALLPGELVPIRINADDPSFSGEISSGVSHVEFFWHSGDWQNSNWVFLGSDWDGLDGWRYNWDVSGIPDQFGIGIFARVYDWVGNPRGVAVWNLRLFRNHSYLPLLSK